MSVAHKPEEPNEPVLQARLLLDEALTALGTRHEGQAEAAGSIELVAQALGHVYEALAAHNDAHTFHERRVAAATVLRQALAALQELPTVLALAGDPVRGATEALKLLFTPRPPPFETGYRFAPRPGDEGPHAGSPLPPTPASFEEPRALSVAREPLVPVVPLPLIEAKAPVVVTPPPPDPIADGMEPLTDLEAMRARSLAAAAAVQRPARKKKPKKKVVPPATDADAERETFGVAQEPAALVHHHARSFFEDLGMMSLMRLPDAGDFWRDLAPVETRLLARLDGLLAAGLPTVASLVHLLARRPMPDPELRWAAIFFYGSLVGDDARDQVARLVRTAELEEENVFDAVADALFFAPHPELEGLLRAWLEGGTPALRQLAVRVLGRRRRLTSAEALAAATSSDLSLAREGARALITITNLGPVDPRALHELMAHDDEKVVEAALHAAFVHKQAFALERARLLFAEKGAAFASSALWLALAGGADVGGWFLEALARKPSPALFEAIGWFGHVGLIEPLLGALAADETDAVGALFRITGAPLTDDDPLPTYDEGTWPFQRAPEPFEPPAVVELSADAGVWSAWWKEHRRRAEPRLRYRLGVVWSPALSLWEMSDAPATPRDRMRAHLELLTRTGGDVFFDPLDFVVRQEAPLAAWKAHLQSRWRPAQDGSWTNIWGGR